MVCLMTGKIVNTYSASLETIGTVNHTLEGAHLPMHNTEIHTPLQVATAVTFTVGIIQVN